MLAVLSVFVGGVCAYCVTPFTLGFSVVPLIEGIVYMTKTDEQFQQAYVIGRRGWF